MKAFAIVIIFSTLFGVSHASASYVRCTVRGKNGDVLTFKAEYTHGWVRNLHYKYLDPDRRETEVTLSCGRMLVFYDACGTTNSVNPVEYFTHYINGTWTIILFGDESVEHPCELVGGDYSDPIN
jgi:hypothetical protein